MTVPTPPVCPKCGSYSVSQHCIGSRTCDLLRCERCKAFGTKDGRLWYDDGYAGGRGGAA